MYSIDINLLRERTGESVTQGDFTSGSTSSMAPQAGSKIPIFIGMGVGALALLATGGSWFFTNDQTAKLEAKQKELDTTLGSLKAKESRLQALTSQLTLVKDETKSLSTVFDQIQPWSAILQDLRENIPQGVRIESISQTEEASPSATPGAPGVTPPPNSGLISRISTPPNPEAKPSASPTPTTPGGTTSATPATGTPSTNGAVVNSTLPAEIPTTKLVITGSAKSFEDVNNFVLTLKQSSFFNPNETQLMGARLAAIDPLKGEMTVGTNIAQGGGQSVNLPDGKNIAKKDISIKMVGFAIQTTIKRVPANELIQELERKGAVGLVARLKSLQQQQVRKP